MVDTNMIRLDTTKLELLAKWLDRSVEDVLVSLAFDVEKHAKQLAPVDTGALRASIYTRTKRNNRLPSVMRRLAKGTQRKKKAFSETLRVEEIPAPEGHIIATIGPAVDYGIYVELGTHHMAARPYLSTACEIVAIELNKDKTWEKLFR